MSRDITQLHPRLQVMANTLVEECRKQGLLIKITDCVRDEREQMDCVARGTSHVLYPNSHHNWGTAFDFCRNDGRGAYNNDDHFFQRVGKIGEGIGLEWGGSWTSPVDMPHFQLSDWGTGVQQLKRLYGNPSIFAKTWVVTPVQPKRKGEFEAMTDNEKKAFINEHLYIPYLGRVADEQGLAYWMTQIDEDTKYIELVKRFAALEESRAYAVKCAYNNIYHRKPDEPGKKFWTDWLQSNSVKKMYLQMIDLLSKGNK